MSKVLKPGQILILKDNTVLIYKQSKDNLEVCPFCYCARNNLDCVRIKGAEVWCDGRGYLTEVKAGL